jgi:hypothetical protein
MIPSINVARLQWDNDMAAIKDDRFLPELTAQRVPLNCGAGQLFSLHSPLPLQPINQRNARPFQTDIRGCLIPAICGSSEDCTIGS